MLILNDRVPVSCHDPVRITKQLKALCAELEVGHLLLDLQRPNVPETARIVNTILGELTGPVGVSELYAKGLDCPVFLSAPPPYRTLEEHICPWQGREIWLEIAPDGCMCTVTEADNRIVPCQSPDAPLMCQKLHCHYGIEEEPGRINITMERTWEDLKELLNEAETLGITKAVGLYQQLRANIRDRL